jgi:hypothetical protein
MVTESMLAEAPRSTCHHAFTSRLVAVTEPLKKLLSVLLSTAAPALGDPG